MWWHAPARYLSDRKSPGQEEEQEAKSKQQVKSGTTFGKNKEKHLELPLVVICSRVNKPLPPKQHILLRSHGPRLQMTSPQQFYFGESEEVKPSVSLAEPMEQHTCVLVTGHDFNLNQTTDVMTS